jgi:GntR family transcriptional regulator, transcriptional repressor for pyruvate dehydrogenase complex
MALVPVARKSLSGDVFDQLAAEILEGRFEAGAMLPSERELAEALQVNRGAIREAVHRLAQAGLVDTRHGSGHHVLDYRRTAGLDFLPKLLFRPDGDVDLDLVRSVLEMRSALGPDVARAAAGRRDDAQLAELRRLCREHAAAAGDLDAQQRLSIAYWDVLVDASGNIAYRLAYNSLRHVYETVREAVATVLGDEISDAARLAQITDAVAAGDPTTAAEVARALCERGRRGLEQALAAVLDD